MKDNQNSKQFNEDMKVIESFFNRIFFNKENNRNKNSNMNSIILAIFFAIIYYYIFLPPINIKSAHSWFYIGAILAILGEFGNKKNIFVSFSSKAYKLMFLVFVLLQLTGLSVFRSKSYANIIDIKTSDFNQDIEELPIDKIPTLDKESSIKVGARKMGELLDLVSQFNIDEKTYTQINYKDRPVRVTPLKYNGFLKYIFNSSDGIPGYIKIDIVSGEAELVKLENKIKISKEDYFFRDVKRYARLRYPTEIFEEISFEIDEKGEPYWIIPTYEPNISFFNAKDVNGAILINASTGEHKKYSLDEIPQWVDRVFESNNIIQQLNWNGKYQGGFFNSIFAQKNVLKTTEGYNYLALKDDIYLYTGYTSVAADESNVGFILSNLRTKDTKFYPISSAEEFSAMESAEGAVQEKNYKATFPLLLNIDGKPTYFLSLKDNAQLIKLYAFIDAQNYQKVSVGNTVELAMSNYTSGSLTSGEDDNSSLELLEKSGIIEDIKSVVIEGNTHYYFTIQDESEVFVSSISLSDKLPFMKNGQEIKFKYYKKNINEVIIIDKIN